MRRKNLHLIDDALIIAGWLVALLTILIVIGVAVEPDSAGFVISGVFVAMTASLLVPGYRLRRRENIVVAVWGILESAFEVRVPELMRATGFSREEVEAAVRVLNNRGLAYYIHDPSRDVIRDGRLAASAVHVETCPNCGATIHADVAFDLSGKLVCRYCQHAVSSAHLAKLKGELISELRAAPPAAVATQPAQFKVGLFIALMLCFWPAALIYALKCFSPAAQAKG